MGEQGMFAAGVGAEAQRLPAIIVIGGLLSSTFLKLVLLPVLYEWGEKKSLRQAESQIHA